MFGTGKLTFQFSAPTKKYGGRAPIGGGNKCYNCNQTGHMSRNCPEARKPRGGGGGGGRGGYR